MTTTVNNAAPDEHRLKTTMRQQRSLLLIMLLYFLLALSYMLATPPLESSDEYKHYPVVQHFQTTGELPVLDPDNPGRWFQAAAQPPLYYMMMAVVTRGIDSSNLAAIHETNPYLFIGDTRHSSNNNIIIHTPSLETFPWHGAVLAIYVIRFVSILLGLGTILLTFRLGELLAGRSIGLLAAGLTAFNPMFLFISAAVNNDSLAALLGALGIYMLVWLWRNRPDPANQPLIYLATGIVVGMGAITKLSLAGIGLVAALVFLILAWRQRSWRFLVWSGVLGGLPAILIIIPMLWRNFELYGDLTGLSAFIAVQGIRQEAITWADWVSEFGTLYRTFWGLFGGLNIAAPKWFYALANGAVIVGVLGLVRQGWLARKGSSSADNRFAWATGGWQLILWLAILFILLVRWTIIYQSFQGRLLFPGLSSFNVLWAVGLWAFLAGFKLREQAATLFLGLAFIVAAALPWTTIRPAYIYPEAQLSVPTGHQFGPIQFMAGERTIELIGVDVQEPERLLPDDEPVRVTLYWQADGPTEVDYLSAVSLLGFKRETVARINRYPASGAIPTSDWQAGQIWRDEYELFVDSAAYAPVQLTIRVALYDPIAEVDLPAFDPEGNQILLLTVGQARLSASEPASLPGGEPVAFANGLNLFYSDIEEAGLAAGQAIELELFWQVEAVQQIDYTVFIHLLDEAGQFVLGADGPPAGGFYPSSIWQPGDLIRDLHAITLPDSVQPGTYSLAIGLYDPASGARLLRPDGNDHLLLNLEVISP